MTLPVERFHVAGPERPVAPTPGDKGRSYAVIYDGNCTVCTKLVRVLCSWDKKKVLEVLPSQTPGLAERFPWISAQAYRESIQVIRRSDRHTWQGAAAIEAVLDVLPMGKLVAWTFSIPFARPLAEKLYRWFARNRYHLGCGEHCQLRTTPPVSHSSTSED